MKQSEAKGTHIPTGAISHAMGVDDANPRLPDGETYGDVLHGETPASIRAICRRIIKSREKSAGKSTLSLLTFLCWGCGAETVGRGDLWCSGCRWYVCEACQRKGHELHCMSDERALRLALHRIACAECSPEHDPDCERMVGTGYCACEARYAGTVLKELGGFECPAKDEP